MTPHGNPAILRDGKDIGKNFGDPLSTIFTKDENGLAIPGTAHNLRLRLSIMAID